MGSSLPGRRSRAHIALVRADHSRCARSHDRRQFGVRSLEVSARPQNQPRSWCGRRGAGVPCFSAEDPESLRGPQFDAAWCDELCFWSYPDETLATLQHAMRLGERPRALVTTTRPIGAEGAAGGAGCNRDPCRDVGQSPQSGAGSSPRSMRAGQARLNIARNSWANS
ncbi:MAG: terminase family protein [Hyphomonadaceae bacterium]